MPADCALPTPPDQTPCGVVAVGRCRECGQAFCVSHQAQAAPGRAEPDRCSPCAVGEKASARREIDAVIAASLARERQARSRIEKIARALVAHGSPGSRSFFGSPLPWEESDPPVRQPGTQAGWPVGMAPLSGWIPPLRGDGFWSNMRDGEIFVLTNGQLASPGRDIVRCSSTVEGIADRLAVIAARHGVVIGDLADA